MKIKALLLMFFCAMLVVPIAADEGMDEAARQHLRDKYTIPADSFRPVIQLFEDGSQSFVCDKVELDYYYTLLQDDLDEGIDNYQNYAYIIDTAREEPVIRTNRYDMRGILRKQMIAMPQLDVTRPKRLPFKIRSLKKDEGLTQWYIDVNDDYRGVQKDGKGTVNYDIYLSPFHIENYEHNNLIFNELVDVTISVIRAQDGKEPEIKRYTLTKSKPKITFVGGQIEVSHEQGMKHIRLVDDGSFGYGQLKFEVEGSGASITKDPSKPLNDLPMGLRARFDMFDSKRIPTNFSQLDEVRILEEHNTPRGTMVHHVYSNDRNYGCSLTDLKQKHDKYVDSIVNRMVTRFKQLDESSKQSLLKKHDVKTSQDLADLMEHYDLNIYPFEPINKFPQQESSKNVIQDVKGPTEIITNEMKAPVEKKQSDNQGQFEPVKTNDVAPDSKRSESKALGSSQLEPIRDTLQSEQLMDQSKSIQSEPLRVNDETKESKTMVSNPTKLDQLAPQFIPNKEIMPVSHVQLERILDLTMPFDSSASKNISGTLKQADSEPVVTRNSHYIDSNYEDTIRDSLPSLEAQARQHLELRTSGSLESRESISQQVALPGQANVTKTQTVETSGETNLGTSEVQTHPKNEVENHSEQAKAAKGSLKPLHSKPKYLPATGVTEQSSWFLGSLLCILGILLRHKR